MSGAIGKSTYAYAPREWDSSVPDKRAIGLENGITLLVIDFQGS